MCLKTKSKMSIKHAARFKLDAFLKSHIRSDDIATHTSFIGGRWHIPDDELDDFYRLYAEAVKYFPMHIVEIQHDPVRPITVDLDFKLLTKEQIRSFDVAMATRIVAQLTEILIDMFGVNYNYTCVFSQRPVQALKKYVWTDGMHFHFPYIVCDKKYHKLLRDIFVGNSQIEIYGGWKNVYDNVISNWCLYLSTKTYVAPYEIVKIFNNDELDSYYHADKIESVHTFVDLLSVRNRNKFAIQNPPNIAPAERVYVRVEQNDDHPALKSELANSIHYRRKLIRGILEIIDAGRAHHFWEWYTIGIMFYYCHVTNNNPRIDFFKLWTQWSKQSNKYDEYHNEKMWDYYSTFDGYDYSFENLCKIAHEDDPVRYNFLAKKYLN